MNDHLPPPKHGFRMSALDGVVLLLGIILSIWLRNEAFPLWWLVPMALGHFFLFCNVFLVWRKLELTWAAVFVINTGLHIAQGCLDWLSPLLFQLPVTLFVIVQQMRSPWYHGAWARHLNPHLSDYLNLSLKQK